MAKRTANNDLNHENWDEEYDPEDAGSFKRASAEVLKTRVYKTARRRNPIASIASTSTSDESPDKRNVFGGLTGFSKAPVSTTTAFGFLYNNSKPTKPDSQPKVNGISHLNTTMDSNPAKVVDNSQHDDAYLSKLKGLNNSVASWIKRHVDENPFVNLKPVFRDYEKYFDELESQKKSGQIDSKLTVDSIASTSKSFCFGIKPTVGEKPPDTIDTAKLTIAPSPNLANMFNFGQQTKTTSATSTTTTSSSTAPKFSFGTSSVVSPQTTSATSTTSLVTSMFKPPPSDSGFSFAGTAQPVSSTPFSFVNVSVSSTSITGTADGGTVPETDEEEPPKVEFTPVDEKGYVYKVRCKVFVKKDKEKSFGDRGVGNMFLKPIPDSTKMQLIVRADTNLGNLLCNFVLSTTIPTKRIGKKDVMLVCIPTPEVSPPPVPILLRVKSAEEADELLATLEKHKK